MNSLKNIIWDYYNNVIPVNEWKWVCLSPNREVYYLFVNNNQSILTVYTVEHYDIKNYMMGDYYVYISDSLMKDYVYIFGKNNYNLCYEIFIKWVENNIPLVVNKTDYIGGIKRS